MAFQPGPDYSGLVNDASLHFVASHLSKISQWPRQSTTRIWSGRIEKSRSTHGSPAFHGRRRAWTGAVDDRIQYTPNTIESSGGQHHWPAEQYQRTFQQRPLSWHPSNHQLKSTNTSPPFGLGSFHTPQNIQPIIQTTTPVQLPHMNQIFDSPPDLYLSNGPSASPNSSVYSMDCASNPSPTFQIASQHQSPIHPVSTQRIPHSPPMHWMPFAYSHALDTNPKPLEIYGDAHFNTTSSPAKYEEKDAEVPYVQEDEDDGEVLVALGLYDPPEVSHLPLLPSGKGLKLAESWQPPEEGADGENDENSAEDEEEEGSNNASSWTESLTKEAQASVSRVDDDFKSVQRLNSGIPTTKDWWCEQPKQPTIQGSGFWNSWVVS